MLTEVSRCLDSLSSDASLDDYRTAIVGRNILGKHTESTRRESFRRLRELYALDPSMPLFRVYRELCGLDHAAIPLLSLLVACARDPLLRVTVPLIDGVRAGEIVDTGQFDDVLERAFPGHIKPTVRMATARHLAASWTQSGHLAGRRPKIRVRVEARPATIVMALLMGALLGVQGESIFATLWCRALDLNAAQARALAMQANREGLIDLRILGSVVEVAFPRFADVLKNGAHDESL